jgi:PRC-barrel domain
MRDAASRSHHGISATHFGWQMKKTRATALSLAALVCAWVYCGPTAAQISTQSISPSDNPAVVPTAADIASGKLVQSPEGRGIGTVTDVVSDPAGGRLAYVLVATESGTAAIPFWAIIHLLRDAHLVIDRSTLASAPRLNNDRIRSNSDETWKQRADQYWQAYR